VSLGSGDIVSVSAGAEAGSLSLAGTGTISFAGDSTLTVAGAFVASAGRIEGTGTLVSDGAFSKVHDGIIGGTFFIRENADLILNEDSSIDGGAIGLDNQGTTDPHLRINQDFTIAEGADANPFPSTSGPRIHVNAPDGHLIKAGAGAKSSGTGIDNDGTLTVQAGTFKLDGHGVPETSDGAYIANAGATLEFANNIAVGASGRVGGAGTIAVSGLNLTVAAGATFDPAVLTLKFVGTLDLNGTSPVDLPALNIDGSGFLATLDSSRPVTTDALSVTSGAIQGDFELTVSSGGDFSKTTGGPFYVRNSGGQGSPDLVLNADASLEGGSMCVSRNSGDDPDQPNLHINRDFTIGAGADAVAFPCTPVPALDPRVHVNGPNGHLLKAGPGTTTSSQLIHVAGGTASIGAGQTLALSNGLIISGGLAEIASGGVLQGPVAMSGGALGGSGQVTGSVNNLLGTVRPGASPGALTITGNYTQGGGGRLQIDVDGNSQGTTYDHLDVGGAASLDGTLAVLQGAGFDPLITDTFQFLTSASRTGTFSSLTGANLPSGKSYELDYPGAPDFGARLLVDPGPPRFSIDDVAVDETDGDRDGEASFTVALNQPAPPGGIEVDAATANGTANANEDYRPFFTTLSFGAGQTSKALSADLLGDFEPESDETFFVDLSNPTNGGVIGDGRGVATIRNDDGAGIPEGPAVSIDDIGVLEGNGRETEQGGFTLSLDRPPGDRGLDVDVTTADGTAEANVDYSPRDHQTVHFNADQTAVSLPVNVFGDLQAEPDETFAVDLSNPRGSGLNPTLADPRGIATIRNDDARVPNVSVGDVELPEGNTATRAFAFAVSLDEPAPAGGVAVDVATRDGTARDPGDYLAKAARLEFGAGQQHATFAVRVKGDESNERDESFSVQLSNAAGAAISDAEGEGRIANDDGKPKVSVEGPVAGAEGDTGRTTFKFTVALDRPAPTGGVSVDFATRHDFGGARGSAEASDFERQAGTLSFPRGADEKVVKVPVTGDRERESDERFALEISEARGGALADRSAIGAIENDDGAGENFDARLTLFDVSAPEGDAGETQFGFEVRIDRPAPAGGIAIDYRTDKGSATAGEDYTEQQGTVTIPQGQVGAEILVPVHGDQSDEDEEEFALDLLGARGLVLPADRHAVGTILNDDDQGVPNLTVDGLQKNEGDAGETPFAFGLHLDRDAPPGGVTVDVRPVKVGISNTARPGEDFVALEQTISIPEGERGGTAVVLVRGDRTSENPERFNLEVTGVVGAGLAHGGVGEAVIRNDDG
jgi:hypothetical protein